MSEKKTRRSRPATLKTQSKPALRQCAAVTIRAQLRSTAPWCLILRRVNPVPYDAPALRGCVQLPVTPVLGGACDTAGARLA